MKSTDARRNFLLLSAGIGAGVLLDGCVGNNRPNADEKSQKNPTSNKEPDNKEIEVTATEDLMREHGILRRALIIYSIVAIKLRGNPSAIPPEALQKTAKLFRAFGEEYHEKKLEEAYIFPAVKRTTGPVATLPDILAAQHQRGREITDFIIAVTQPTKLSTNNIEPLAKTLESFVLMYRNHAAREDTLIFPAWKQTLSAKELDEIGDKFEDIEHKQFGKDGFEDAVKQITEIENSLGLTDLAQFTAPPPPKL